MRVVLSSMRFVPVVILAVLAACSGPATDADPARPITRAIERGTGDGPVLVMLHGYGSGPESFLGFADRTDFPPGTRIFLPYAPDATHPPEGPEGGFMWWSFTTDFHDPRELVIPAMADARARVGTYLDQLAARLHVSSDHIVLGGFSQGAMLALDFALHDARPLAGLVLLSGSYVDRAAWRPLMASRRGTRVYQSHGREDDVLDYGPAEELSHALRDAGLDVRFRPFEGRHEVTLQVSEEAAGFVREVTGYAR